MPVYRYYGTCVDWPRHDVYRADGLCDMSYHMLDISRQTFLQHVDRAQLAELEAALGYNTTLHMASDYAVTYFRSKLHGFRVYGFRHSAIEYIFVPEGFV